MSTKIFKGVLVAVHHDRRKYPQHGGDFAVFTHEHMRHFVVKVGDVGVVIDTKWSNHFGCEEVRVLFGDRDGWIADDQLRVVR